VRNQRGVTRDFSTTRATLGEGSFLEVPANTLVAHHPRSVPIRSGIAADFAPLNNYLKLQTIDHPASEWLRELMVSVAAHFQTT
jgi:hypothetical protein